MKHNVYNHKNSGQNHVYRGCMQPYGHWYIYIYIYLCNHHPNQRSFGNSSCHLWHNTQTWRKWPRDDDFKRMVQGVEKWIPLGIHDSDSNIFHIHKDSRHGFMILKFSHEHLEEIYKTLTDYNTLTIFDLKDLRYYLSPTLLDCPYGTIVSILDCSRRSAWSSPRAWA